MHFQFKDCFRLEYLNSTPPPCGGGGVAKIEASGVELELKKIS
jgi:hypothetical protein